PRLPYEVRESTDPARHARFPLLYAHHERDAVRGADRLAPADAACRADPPGGRWDLCLAAARPEGPQEDRADRARGDEPRRRRRNPDADPATLRSLEGNRPL